jgi:hypothetical protein
MPRPTMARIKAYSAAEAPDSSRKNVASLDIGYPCSSLLGRSGPSGSRPRPKLTQDFPAAATD